MHSIKHFSFLFLCFSMSILLSACGSKGALYQEQELEIEQKTTTEKSQESTEEPKKKQS